MFILSLGLVRKMKNHEIKTIYPSFNFGFFGIIQTFQYIFIQFDSLQRFYEQELRNLFIQMFLGFVLGLVRESV